MKKLIAFIFGMALTLCALCGITACSGGTGGGADSRCGLYKLYAIYDDEYTEYCLGDDYHGNLLNENWMYCEIKPENKCAIGHDDETMEGTYTEEDGAYILKFEPTEDYVVTYKVVFDGEFLNMYSHLNNSEEFYLQSYVKLKKAA